MITHGLLEKIEEYELLDKVIELAKKLNYDIDNLYVLDPYNTPANIEILKDKLSFLESLENKYYGLPDTIDALDRLMFERIGFIKCVFEYKSHNYHDQKPIVDRLCYDFFKNRITFIDNKEWYQEQVYNFIEETENII